MKLNYIILSLLIVFSACVSQRIPNSERSAKRKLARHYRAIERIDKVFGLLDSTRVRRVDTLVIQEKPETIRTIQWDSVRISQGLDALMDSLFSLRRSPVDGVLPIPPLKPNPPGKQAMDDEFEQMFREKVIYKVINESFPRDSLIVDNDTVTIRVTWDQGVIELTYLVKDQEVVTEDVTVEVDTDPYVPFWQSNKPLWYLGLGSVAMLVLYIWFGRYLHPVMQSLIKNNLLPTPPPEEPTAEEEHGKDNNQ